MVSWIEKVSTHGCGLSGCLGHCSTCGMRYAGSCCFGPSCPGCGPRVSTDTQSEMALTENDIRHNDCNERVLKLAASLVGAPRPPDETAWLLALRAEHVSETRTNPMIRYLPRGEELKHELIVISVVLEQVYGLPPPPPRWGIRP